MLSWQVVSVKADKAAHFDMTKSTGKVKVHSFCPHCLDANKKTRQECRCWPQANKCKPVTGLCKKVMPIFPSKVDEATDKAKETLIACKGKVDLLDSWPAGPFNFHLSSKQRPGWAIANDNWEIMLKNTRPSGIDVSEVDKVVPPT